MTEKFDLRLGNVLLKHRLIKGFSQKQVGEALGVTYQLVQSHEKGKARLSVYQFLHVCDFLDVSYTSVIEETLGIRSMTNNTPGVDEVKKLLKFKKTVEAAVKHY